MTENETAATGTVPPPTKLVGKGTQGNFVHKYQQMGTQQGFKNVSASWLETGCLSYDEVFERLEAGHDQIEDLRKPLKAMEPALNDKNQFVMRFKDDGREFIPTPYALEQIANYAGCGQGVVKILSGQQSDTNKRNRNRPQDREILVNLITSGFNLIEPDKEHLFRTQKDGTMRAMLSSQYQIMDNRWFMNILKDIVPNGVLSHWKEDGDLSTLWGNILIPDSIRAEPDSDYGGMFSIGNSEIGRRNLTGRPSLFRAICCNGCIWDRTRGTAFKQVHRGKTIDLFALAAELKENLTTQIPLITTVIDDFIGTKAIGWDGASALPVFSALGNMFRLNKTENTRVFESWQDQSAEEEVFADDKNRRTAFAVINAVTRSANKVADKDPQGWVQRDEMGGTLFGWNKERWSHLFTTAKQMKKEDVEKSFLNTVLV